MEIIEENQWVTWLGQGFCTTETQRAWRILNHGDHGGHRENSIGSLARAFLATKITKGTEILSTTTI